LIYNYFAKPFSVAIIPLAAIAVFKRDTNKIFVVFTIIIIIESVFIDGGRFVIYFLACNFFVAYKFFGKTFQSRTEKRKGRFIITIAIIVSFAFIWVVSVSRGIADIGQSLYHYVCGCVPHLDLRIQEVLHNGSITYGYASNNGIIEFILTMFENIGISFPNSYIQARALMNVENIVNISKTGFGSFNAFVGPFFYLYLDFRWIGIIFGMGLYGFSSYYFYKSSKQTKIRKLAIYMLLAQGLFSSMVRLQFNNMYYVLGFVYILICTKKCFDGEQVNNYE